MSLQSVAKEFVELCNEQKNFDVMNSMYAPNIISVEADGSATAGKDAVIEKSRKWGESTTIESERVDGPFFNGPETFAVHYVFEMTPKDTGVPTRLEEVAVYTVQDDRIIREEFFYDGSL